MITIEPKRDFDSVGFYINRKWIRKGWLAVYRGCNIVDGAGWFLTRKEGLAWKRKHGAEAMRRCDKVLGVA
jgi:hypothetical protein